MTLVRTEMFRLHPHSCPICLQEQLIVDILGCGHRFCRECLLKALVAKNACPMCRAVPIPIDHCARDVKDDS
jgi:hypothetical protein